MISRSRLFVIFSIAVIALAPLVSTSLLVFNPGDEPLIGAESDLVQETNDILSKLKDEGVDFDDTTLPTDEMTIPFGGFIQNQGQISDDSLKYYFSSKGGSVGFSDSEVVIVCLGPDEDSVRFSVTFPGSNNVAPDGAKKKVHVVNYIQSDLQLSNVPTFDEIIYSGLYDGIDLRYYMSEKGLKYEFIVHPGADPSIITLTVSDSVSLVVEEESVSFNVESQMIFQDTGLDVFQKDGTKVPTQFTGKQDTPNSYGFNIESYDSEQILIIDPWFLPFSTFVTHGWMGASLEGVAVDSDGNSYVTGDRYVDFWPENRNDLYVGKISSNGTSIYSTYYYLGDEDRAHGYDIEIDDAGDTYICGYTDSYSFPTSPDANDTSFNGGSFDAFVARLNSSGGMEYSTYLGGSGNDYAYGISFDPSTNEICVVGVTASSDFPMQDAYDSSFEGDTDGFVVKYTADGSEFVYSTYLGGSMKDTARGVDVDSDGYCYVTGYTNSSDFPTPAGSWDALHGGGDYDAFITILDPDGQDLNQSAYLGGVENDYGYAVTVGDDGRCYIVGQTKSANYPITSALQSYHADYDAFLTVSTDSHDTIEMSTFIGSNYVDSALNVILGPDDKLYIVGSTYGDDFVQVNPYNSTHGGSKDAFVMRINSALDTIEFSTFLGGLSTDDGKDVGVDSSGNIYVAGDSSSSDFPLVREYQDYGESYLTKFAEDTTNPVITLNDPEEGLTIHPVMDIDLDVTDDWFVDTVLYAWDDGNNVTLSEPYDVPVPNEKTYVLHVYANDSAGNEVSETYTFIRSTSWLMYSTFLGGSVEAMLDTDNDRGTAIALDAEGNAYVAGNAKSLDFPTLNPMNASNNGNYDIFLSKFSPDGTLLYSTYIGGPLEDQVWDIEIDGSGNVYLCGYTRSSTGFPIINAQNDTFGGGLYDGYLMKVNSTGNGLIFSTFLGGNSYDSPRALELDAIGNIYVVGDTQSNDFPIVNAFSDTKGAGYDLFLSKYSPSGQDLLYSTFIGGDDMDIGIDIALDTDGYCYLIGYTHSTDYPTYNAMNSTKNGVQDIIITKMKPGEPSLNYSTYFGCSGNNQGRGIAVDAAGVAYIVGWASTSDYPLKNEIQIHQGNNDVVVTAINQTGTGVLFSTYLGTTSTDEGNDIAIGPDGHVYITGSAAGNGIPVENAYDSTYAGSNDVIVAKFNLAGDELEFCTYLGGTSSDYGWRIAVHTDGTMFITGGTSSSTYPTINAFQETYESTAGDAFVTRIGIDKTAPTINDPPDTAIQVGTTGNNVTWIPDDDSPDSYQIFINGSLLDEGVWDDVDENITVSVDGLAEEVYNVTIVVYDEGGNSDTHTIWVTVVNDDTAPTIDIPDDITYDEFTTGHWMTWTPSDDYPSNYTIYRNGVVINSDPWDGNPVGILIDGLPYGDYNHTIVVYDIGGNSVKDTAWVHVVDGTWPGIDRPDDVIIDEGSTGNTLTWSPTDANPASYAIYRNGTELESGPWSGEVVAISIDGLSLGVYNYTVYLLDIDDNWQRDIVFVTVIDGTAPVIDSPIDLEIEQGDTGNEIEWSPSDLHPTSYEILMDDTSIVTGDWTGGTITVSVDGLAAGTYNFTVVLMDVGGNTVSDSVFVTVTAASTTPTTTTTPTTPPEGVDIIVIIIIAGAGGAILIIIIYACSKKKS